MYRNKMMEMNFMKFHLLYISNTNANIAEVTTNIPAD